MTELDKDLIDRILKFYKSVDCKYFVIKIEDFLHSVSKLEYIDFENMLKNYNEYREEQDKKINDYFVVNRDDFPEFKTSDEFFEFLNKSKR